MSVFESAVAIERSSGVREVGHRAWARQGAVSRSLHVTRWLTSSPGGARHGGKANPHVTSPRDLESIFAAPAFLARGGWNGWIFRSFGRHSPTAPHISNQVSEVRHTKPFVPRRVTIRPTREGKPSEISKRPEYNELVARKALLAFPVAKGVYRRCAALAQTRRLQQSRVSAFPLLEARRISVGSQRSHGVSNPALSI